MVKATEAFGKFVRLNLTGEIVEVVGFDSTEIIVNFKGKILTMEHHQISRITSEEAEAAARRIQIRRLPLL